MYELLTLFVIEAIPRYPALRALVRSFIVLRETECAVDSPTAVHLLRVLGHKCADQTDQRIWNLIQKLEIMAT